MFSVLAVLASIAAVSGQSCSPSYGGHSIYDEVTAPDVFQVTMTLLASSAPIVIEVNRTWSPVGADHFYALLRDGYFQCAAFYTIQTGTNSYAQTGIAAETEATTKVSISISKSVSPSRVHSRTSLTRMLPAACCMTLLLLLCVVCCVCAGELN